MNNEKEILDGVQSQISSFDNKASILLSVVGIIFALTLSFLDGFHAEFFVQKPIAFKAVYNIIFIIYIAITITLIIFLILVILPRSHKKDNKYPNYYKDINDLSKEELKQSINVYNKDNELILDQIKINAQICMKKHKWLKMGIIFFIPFMVCIVIMILMMVFA